jgi:hypothetical protein
VRWTIEDSDNAAALWYREGERSPMLVWRWPPGSSARFQFRHRDQGEWSEDWEWGQPEQLPANIQLVIEQGDQPLDTVTAAIAIRTRQEVYTDDILFGRE